jgi:hypothetical protein
MFNPLFESARLFNRARRENFGNVSQDFGFARFVSEVVNLFFSHLAVNIDTPNDNEPFLYGSLVHNNQQHSQLVNRLGNQLQTSKLTIFLFHFAFLSFPFLSFLSLLLVDTPLLCRRLFQFLHFKSPHLCSTRCSRSL